MSNPLFVSYTERNHSLSFWSTVLASSPYFDFKGFKGIRQYIFLLFHFKELLKLYINLLYRFCVTLLFLEIFWLKIICCPPSWINFYLIIGDFSDVKSRVSHIKLHPNDQITLSLVWKVVRQFFISNSYWSIWFWAHNNQLLYG
jgi:hypothetical protein